MFQSVYTTIITNVQKSLGKGSGWITDSVIDHTISISKYNLLAGSSYIKLPKELNSPRKGLINIWNVNDNECLKWCLAKYLNPADHHPVRIIKVDKDFETFTKSKTRIPSTLAFLVMKIRKNIQSMYQKNVANKNILTYYWLDEEKKNAMFLSMNSIDSYMIIHYIAEKNIFRSPLSVSNPEKVHRE